MQVNTFQEELALFKIIAEEVGKNKLGEILPFSIRLSDIKGAYGSASIDPRFENGEIKFLDLVINPTFLFFGGNLERNITTTIHEVIHMYCRTHNIKEVSNNNRYHNKKFGSLAAQCGLLTGEDKTIGVTTPGLSDDMKIWLQENKPIQEAIARVKMKALPVEMCKKTVKKQSFVAYVCPECGAKVRAKRDMHILCLDCSVPFEEQ